MHSERLGSKVKQKIVKHVGVAMDDRELEELKLLANAIKAELESKNQLPLYTPQEIASLAKRTQEKKINTKVLKANELDRDDYAVNLLDLLEEDRIIKGIHDVYGKLYDEIGFTSILPSHP